MYSKQYPHLRAATAVATLIFALNASASGLTGGMGGIGGGSPSSGGGGSGLAAGATAGRTAALPSAPSSLESAGAAGPGGEVKLPVPAGNDDGGVRRGDGPDDSFNVQTLQGRKAWMEVFEALTATPQAPLPVGTSSPEQPSVLREPAENELRHALEARAAKAEVGREPPPEARRGRRHGAGKDADEVEPEGTGNDAASATASNRLDVSAQADLVAALGKLQSAVESLQAQAQPPGRRQQVPQDPGIPWGWIVAAALAGNLAARVGRRVHA